MLQNNLDKFPIENLPLEMQIRIFQHLDIIELCRMAQTNKALQAIIEDDSWWNIQPDIACFKPDYALLSSKKAIVKKNV